MSELANPIDEQQVLKRRRRWRRRTNVLILVVFVSVELIARSYLGLGDPPLMQTDPQIEYLFQPAHTYRRFGNHIHYNQWSMRSDDFEKQKASPDELRILIIGDSVVNGGSLTDDSELATRLIQAELSEKLKRKVVVGNISAGSWGPANQLAYLRRYGLFEADVVVFVWSAHDAADVPDFDPAITKKADFPTRTPICATWEGFTRYFLPRLPFLRPPPEKEPPPPSTQPISSCIDAMKAAIELAKENHAIVVVARHYTQDELGKPENVQHAAIRMVAEQENVPLISFENQLREAVAKGLPVYRDIIHPTAAGQRVITDILEPMIEKAIQSPTPARP